MDSGSNISGRHSGAAILEREGERKKGREREGERGGSEGGAKKGGKIRREEGDSITLPSVVCSVKLLYSYTV